MHKRTQPLPGRTETRPRVITPGWFEQRRSEVLALQQERQDSTRADAHLLMAGAQHPLKNGRWPGKEFAGRLQELARRYNAIITAGGRAAVLLAGSRHHDEKSGQTDDVALYDAGGLFLLEQGVPATALQRADGRYSPPVYNGAMEIASLASAYHRDDRFRTATYVCSPGQKARAETYALAYRLPMGVVVPEALLSNEGDQFHGSLLSRLVLQGLARTIDPYGDRVLQRMTRNRIPADGNMNTIPELQSDYVGLPWHQQAEQS